MSGNDDKRLLTAEEVANRLGIAVGTVYNKVSAGTIPYLKAGRAVRFDWSEIEAWAREQARRPPDDSGKGAAGDEAGARDKAA